MTEVNAILVRQFFELNGFLVSSGNFLYVKKTGQARGKTGDFIMTRDNMHSIRSAAINVKPWHSETFFPSNVKKVLKEISIFTGTRHSRRAEKILGAGEFDRILVLSKLPPSKSTREKSIAMLKESGIDMICLFPEILEFLIMHVRTNMNYSNEALQILRILKCYGFCGAEQPELFRK